MIGCTQLSPTTLPAIGDNAAMEAEPNQVEPPKRKRRWFQFSLRMPFVVTVVLELSILSGVCQR